MQGTDYSLFEFRSDSEPSLAKMLGSVSDSVLLLEKELAASADGTGSLGGDETTLLTAGSVSAGSGGVTNVLMVTTTVRMLDGVHGNTSHAGPVSLLGVGLEVRVVGLQERLVSSLAAGNDADHGSAAADDGLADAGGQSDASLLSVFGVADHDGGGARGTGKNSAISQLGLEVGNDGSLGHRINREDVADSQGRY